jgi:hypothetical protein
MLLAILALALPSAALADTISFSYTTGLSTNFKPFPTSLVFVSPTFSHPTTLFPTVVGTNGTEIAFRTDDLHCPSHGIGLCTFPIGILTVDFQGKTVFVGTIENGHDMRSFDPKDHEWNDVIMADLSPGLAGLNGVAVRVVSGDLSMDAVYTPASLRFGRPISLTASVSGTVVPEPCTLGMLGTGLVGLAGMMGRKLKLGT